MSSLYEQLLAARPGNDGKLPQPGSLYQQLLAARPPPVETGGAGAMLPPHLPDAGGCEEGEAGVASSSLTPALLHLDSSLRSPVDGRRSCSLGRSEPRTTSLGGGVAPTGSPIPGTLNGSMAYLPLPIHPGHEPSDAADRASSTGRLSSSDTASTEPTISRCSSPRASPTGRVLSPGKRAADQESEAAERTATRHKKQQLAANAQPPPPPQHALNLRGSGRESPAASSERFSVGRTSPSDRFGGRTSPSDRFGGRTSPSDRFGGRTSPGEQPLPRQPPAARPLAAGAQASASRASRPPPGAGAAGGGSAAQHRHSAQHRQPVGKASKPKRPAAPPLPPPCTFDASRWPLGAPSDAALAVLDRSTIHYWRSSQAAASECDTAARDLIQRIQASVRQLWPEAQVCAFGSRATGLATAGSDIDLVVTGVGGLDERAPGDSRRQSAAGDDDHDEDRAGRGASHSQPHGRGAASGRQTEAALVKLLPLLTALRDVTATSIRPSAVPVITMTAALPAVGAGAMAAAGEAGGGSGGSGSGGGGGGGGGVRPGATLSIDLSLDSRRHHGLLAAQHVRWFHSQLPLLAPLVATLKVRGPEDRRADCADLGATV